MRMVLRIMRMIDCTKYLHGDLKMINCISHKDTVEHHMLAAIYTYLLQRGAEYHGYMP